MNSKIIKAPHKYDTKQFLLFLAGSIEMGKAENWQDKAEKAFADLDITILNPRRDDWDSSWEQSIDNPQFRKQVKWELDAMDDADLILMYFDPNTKSPITLLELGLYVDTDKLIVCCPEGYWRKGNVDIVCKRYGIETSENLDETLKDIKEGLLEEV